MSDTVREWIERYRVLWMWSRQRHSRFVSAVIILAAVEEMILYHIDPDKREQL
ncbi:hypothetical protein ACFSUP_04250 [Gracilibacillus thailandensis]|uniref:hypothetical protein n=1 Tax=Gracilibacillus thailandensis TaxID=563735 RepID=UPI003629A263